MKAISLLCKFLKIKAKSDVEFIESPPILYAW